MYVTIMTIPDEWKSWDNHFNFTNTVQASSIIMSAD